MKKQFIFNIIIVICLIFQLLLNTFFSNAILNNSDFIKVVSDAVLENTQNITETAGLMTDITNTQVEFNKTLIEKLTP